MLDTRADQPHLVAGKLESRKLDFQQNGGSDDGFLCHEHEISIGHGDKYAVDFIRNFANSAKPVENGRALSAPNIGFRQVIAFRCHQVGR